MIYRVVYSAEAQEQIAEHVMFLRSQGAPDETIEAWYAILFDKVDDLSRFPLRHSLADVPGTPQERPVRRMVYGQYLVFYRVDESAHVVEVLAFRHGHRSYDQLLGN